MPDAFRKKNTLYGLSPYIQSIKRLSEWSHNEVTTLPAHRLYYGGKWNWMDLKERVNEILEHHIDRCAHILSLIDEGVHTVDGIAKGHFDPSLLKGMGMALAKNEIHSHIEFLEAAGDVSWLDQEHLECNGTARFEALIRSR